MIADPNEDRDPSPPNPWVVRIAAVFVFALVALAVVVVWA